MQRKCLAAITCSVCCCFDEGLGWMLRVVRTRRRDDSMRLEHRVLPSSMMPLTGLGFESQATCLLDVVSCEFWRRKPWGSQFRVGTAQLPPALPRQTVEGPVRAGIVEHGALDLSVLSLYTTAPQLLVSPPASFPHGSSPCFDGELLRKGPD